MRLTFVGGPCADKKYDTPCVPDKIEMVKPDSELSEAVRSNGLLASRQDSFVELSDMLAREDEFDSAHANAVLRGDCHGKDA